MVFSKVRSGTIETHFDESEVPVLLDMAGERSRLDLLQGRAPRIIDDMILDMPSGEHAETMHLSIDLLVLMRHGLYEYAGRTAQEVRCIQAAENSPAFWQLSMQRHALGRRAVGLAEDFEDGAVFYGGAVIVRHFTQFLNRQPGLPEAA